MMLKSNNKSAGKNHACALFTVRSQLNRMENTANIVTEYWGATWQVHDPNQKPSSSPNTNPKTWP